MKTAREIADAIAYNIKHFSPPENVLIHEIEQAITEVIAAERAELARLLQFTAEQSAVAITAAVEDERYRNRQAVMDLCLGLRELWRPPRLMDLVHLAKRIRGNK